MTVLPFHTADDVAAVAPLVSEHLSDRGLLAYPTETVYGLGSRARAEDLAALARLKGRPLGKPFLLLVSSQMMALDRGLEFTPAARALAERFWPGPLTLVLPGGEGALPDGLRGPEGGIAVRWTSQVQTARLIAEIGEPITSTSANRPGEVTAPGVGALADSFADAIDAGRLLVLDGGVLGNVPPSTLVDCTGPEPKLVRDGAIPRVELRAGVGRYAP
ncbi:MAG: L-threonylcarbamoyladenylate synthase [Gemmatimonadales bacterium]